MRDNFDPRYIYEDNDDESYGVEEPSGRAAAVVSVLILLVGLCCVIKWVFA